MRVVVVMVVVLLFLDTDLPVWRVVREGGDGGCMDRIEAKEGHREREGGSLQRVGERDAGS
jgi:hypothetical protein